MGNLNTTKQQVKLFGFSACYLVMLIIKGGAA